MNLISKLAGFATVSALAIGSLAVSVTPAAAMNQRDQQALTVILGLGAAAVLLNEMNDKDRKRHHAAPPPAPPRYGYRDDHRGWNDWQNRNDRDRWRDDHRQDRADSRTGHTWDRGRTNRGTVALPDRCVQHVRTANGWRDVVSTSCLANRRQQLTGKSWR